MTKLQTPDTTRKMLPFTRIYTLKKEHGPGMLLTLLGAVLLTSNKFKSQSQLEHMLNLFVMHNILFSAMSRECRLCARMQGVFHTAGVLGGQTRVCSIRQVS